MQFQGDRDFKQLPPEALFEKLSDAGLLAASIPDATLDGEPSPTEAACAVRPGFSFVRGSLDVTITRLETTPPTTLKYRLFSKGVGSSSDVEALLTLTAHDAGTRVHWVAEVKQLGGLLKMVPAGLIRGAAQKVIADVWQGIEERLA